MSKCNVSNIGAAQCIYRGTTMYHCIEREIPFYAIHISSPWLEKGIRRHINA